MTIKCSNFDKKWFFFHIDSCFTNDSEFCKLQCLLKGLQVAFEYLDGEEVDLKEFKNVKQVGKNTYSLFKFFN